MNGKETIKLAALGAAVLIGLVADSHAQGRPPMRAHTATEAQELSLVPATVQYSGAVSAVSETAANVRITGNGVPDHAVGAFPNRGNPHQVQPQSYRFSVTANPIYTGAATPLQRGMYAGAALNGVPFDPGAAEFWQGDPSLGWQYEALGGAVALGLDVNHAHVQPNGSYHYHGVPSGLLADMGWQPGAASPLIGYAADGFPIYALTAELDGAVKQIKSSYQLKSGRRPGGSGPTGAYDGAFVQDYEYRAGSGHLDACNGMEVQTAEYPDGTYAYFLTESFPVVPRRLMGKADRSFLRS